ncbi:MAG: multiubiquitin domain-containing protein [Ferruginibacter sp.]
MSENQSQHDRKGGGKDLYLIIDGKQFKWHDQFINGREIKQLGGIAPEAELYLAISDPWKDELIKNEDRVDLARPGIEQFFEKKALKYTIDGRHFESFKQFIKGAQIRREGAVPDNYDIFLFVNGGYEDEPVEDGEWIDLARPGIEHFISKRLEITIIVNGKEKPWDKKQISFAEIITLAFGTYNNTPTMVYTVGYEDGPKQNPEGSMTKDAIVFVKNKMIFHGTATDKS